MKDDFEISGFENGLYHLSVYGPNGFYREFSGNENDPLIDVIGIYEMIGNRPTGKLALQFNNLGSKPDVIVITDKAYKTSVRTINLGKKGSAKEMIRITLDTSKSFGWYDFSVKIKSSNSFERRYTGRIETGTASKTDPVMGRTI